MVLLLGHSEDGRGQREREGSSVGLWNWCAPEKTTRGAKAVCLCMIQPFIISVFQDLGSVVFSGLRRFFRNPAENFAGLRSGTFFRPKEDPGIYMLSSEGGYHVALFCFIL